VKRLGSQKRRRRGGITGADAEQDQVMTDELLTDFTIEELREFLQADLLDVPVDPRFRERLKRRLWELVREQARRRERADEP
jgi:hypothetical protein